MSNYQIEQNVSEKPSIEVYKTYDNDNVYGVDTRSGIWDISYQLSVSRSKGLNMTAVLFALLVFPKLFIMGKHDSNSFKVLQTTTCGSLLGVSVTAKRIGY